MVVGGQNNISGENVDIIKRLYRCQDNMNLSLSYFWRNINLIYGHFCLIV